jgi:UDP-N-acetylmuramoyl-L-alanyl-D-glutamate--2,6-diaminopimelate ligase
MKLKDLLREVPVEATTGSLDLDIAEVRDDSRAVGQGDLFVALPGQKVDGHAFLGDIVRQGAVAAVVEREVANFPGTLVRVQSTRRALALIASRRHGDAWRGLKMVAVTGTNGKTTTTFLIESILKAAGGKPGVIGTVNYRYDGKTFPANFTTPTALELHAVLAQMKAAGCTHAVMEASSHALALERLAGVEFRVGAFTNLTQDHLDFHANMEEYFRAKALLVRRHLRQPDGVGVIFVDDPYGPRMAKEVVGDRLLVSLVRDGADVTPKSAECTIDGITADLASPMGPIKVRSRLIGRYNLANIAVAAGAAVALGTAVQPIERGIADLSGVPGRVERVDNELGFAVLVDYAHTHDALENVIAALRPVTAGRLLCVFGCGGDRDKTKRPKMGYVVARDADIAIVTSDNPRTEDPRAIIQMILAGVKEEGPASLDGAQLATAKRGLYVEADRRSAIGAAIAAAQPTDVVLIAGKGHEDYQIIGTTRYPFDDRSVALEAIQRRKAVK